jgi:ribosomal protein S18 acetylase RimI-like enzyme
VSVTYRDATAADAKALAAFCARTFVETFGHLYPAEDLSAYLAAKYDEPVQREEIANPHFRYRLAFEGEVLVGYCMMGALDLDVDDPNALELHRLYVDERMKGAGVAMALMADCLAWARAKSADALYLSVWENNHRAQAFYKRYGFEHAGEHNFMVGKTADHDFIWRLAL